MIFPGNIGLPIRIICTAEDKSRMPQIRGVKGEAVVIYCEPLTTKEMGYPRLSHGVNKTVKKDSLFGYHWQSNPVFWQ